MTILDHKWEGQPERCTVCNLYKFTVPLGADCRAPYDPRPVQPKAIDFFEQPYKRTQEQVRKVMR